MYYYYILLWSFCDGHDGTIYHFLVDHLQAEILYSNRLFCIQWFFKLPAVNNNTSLIQNHYVLLFKIPYDQINENQRLNGINIQQDISKVRNICIKWKCKGKTSKTKQFFPLNNRSKRSQWYERISGKCLLNRTF